jgi:hypothetical protein
MEREWSAQLRLAAKAAGCSKVIKRYGGFWRDRDVPGAVVGTSRDDHQDRSRSQLRCVSVHPRRASAMHDAAADNRFLRKRSPCLPAHQNYSKQRQAKRDQNQCKHRSTRSWIASNHPAGVMRTGNAAFMHISIDPLGLLQCAPGHPRQDRGRQRARNTVFSGRDDDKDSDHDRTRDGTRA